MIDTYFHHNKPQVAAYLIFSCFNHTFAQESITIYMNIKPKSSTFTLLYLLYLNHVYITWHEIHEVTCMCRMRLLLQEYIETIFDVPATTCISIVVGLKKCFTSDHLETRMEKLCLWIIMHYIKVCYFNTIGGPWKLKGNKTWTYYVLSVEVIDPLICWLVIFF